MPSIEQLKRMAAEWEERARLASTEDRAPFERIAALYRALIEKLSRRQDPASPD